MNAQLQPTGSAYFIAKETEKPENHTLSVLVDNEPGVLARVIGLFSGRGYNIESLTVSETEHEKHLSRITIVTRGTPHVLEQIKHQLERIVPVHRVVDLYRAGASNSGRSGRWSANWRWSRSPAPATPASRRCGWPMPSAPASSTPTPNISSSRSPARCRRSTSSSPS